jgi:hypothetical protein
VAFPSLSGDELAVTHALLIHPFPASQLQFQPHVAVAGHFSLITKTRSNEHLDAVAYRKEALAGLMEALDQLNEAFVVSQEFWSSPAHQDHGFVILCLDLVDGDVCLNQVTGLLDVGVPPRVKIVNHPIETLFLGSRDNRDHACLTKTVDGIENFKGFACIIRDDEYLFLFLHGVIRS